MLPVIRVGPAVIQSAVIAALAAFYLGAYVTERECKRRGMRGDDAWNSIGIGAAVMLVAGRLVYAAQNLSAYAADPLQLLAPAPGTLAFYPGAIFGALAAYAYIQRRGVPGARFLDALAPGALSAAALFALGQFLAGDAYGTATNAPWAIFLWDEWRHPVQLYETFAVLNGFAFTLYLARKNPPRAGWLAWFAIAWYAAARVLVDAYRVDAAPLPGGYRASQVAALAVLLVAVWQLANRKWQIAADGG